MPDTVYPAMTPRIWQVGALCRAIADALDARFNPAAVRGEVSGFSRAPSGHCYFSLKDPDGRNSGQIRCAMFRRAASLLDFAPRDGELVEVRGRLDVYGPRGDLQMIVESMSRAGQGALFEQFLKLKAKLEAEGLFAQSRKRALPMMPRGIGVVTSLNAAALHDVVTALRRRVPHIPVVVAPALVQGSSAPGEIMQSLSNLYLLTKHGQGIESDMLHDITPDFHSKTHPEVLRDGTQGITLDVILLVRGGGSIDDLWAFNDEPLARVIAQSPVPVVTGIGHETDFTIADFVADLRAPTPTAAAELVAQPREAWLGALEAAEGRLQDAGLRRIDGQHQRLDGAASRMGRPSALAARQGLRLAFMAQHLRFYSLQNLKQSMNNVRGLQAQMPINLQRGLARQQERLARASLRLGLLDPSLVLQRGYAWLADADGNTIASVRQTHPAQALRATLADGTLDLTVDLVVSGGSK
jgi:exodeoxyribonuclease VII large subunit